MSERTEFGEREHHARLASFEGLLTEWVARYPSDAEWLFSRSPVAAELRAAGVAMEVLFDACKRLREGQSQGEA